jgi:putative transcriptional regulator
MSRPTHHPDPSTLMAFSAGTADEAFSAVIAGHLAYCPDCRAAVRRLETVGGVLMTMEPPEPVSSGALKRLLDAATGAEVIERSLQRWLYREIPLPISSYVREEFAGVDWRTAHAGVSTADVSLHAKAQSQLTLMRLEGGKAAEFHRHGGQELMLVLRGAYWDEFGEYRVGDLADLDGGEHEPHAEPDHECVCLVALDAPITIPPVQMRVVRPFLRF